MYLNAFRAPTDELSLGWPAVVQSTCTDSVSLNLSNPYLRASQSSVEG